MSTKIENLTLEEKAKLTTGKDIKESTSVGDVESFIMLDGPHGLRILADEKVSVCYPPACLIAASFDRSAAKEMGASLAVQCQSAGVNVILGPGLNIKRSPLCGRNFEYYSEDPVLAGEMAAAYVMGVQENGVAACPKHFLANNQEYRRRTTSAQVDERALHELYLEGFYRVVTKAKPVTLMCSYNLVNGEQVAHSRKYLTDVLRGEWGYEGLVISDWGAVKDRAAAVHAGCDLTMAGVHGTDGVIVEAVKKGTLAESDLNDCCERIAKTAEWVKSNRRKSDFSYETAHETARKLAEESIILLKNQDNILPLDASESVLFVGEFAEKPRYQGGGSSAVVPFRVTSALEAAKEIGVSYCKGFIAADRKTNEGLLTEAVQTAKRADKVVVFAGLPENAESEGFDRYSLSIPENQNELIAELAKVNKNIIVVLHNGAPVEMPWLENVKGVVELYLGGQAVGGAAVNILYGKVNPSGRLPETFPARLEDNPTYLTFPGDGNLTFYGESIYVGYRYYEKKKIKPLFPFGYGLSYTEFAYSDLKIKDNGLTADGKLNVSVTVKNTGTRAGKEVVQLYVAFDNDIHRPVRELKGFDKIELAAGESKSVEFTLTKRDFSYYNEEVEAFDLPAGEYKVQICKNAETVILSENLRLEGVYAKHKTLYTMHTPIAEVMKNPAGKAFVEKVLPAFRAMIIKSGYLKGDAAKTMKEAENTPMKNQGLNAQPLNTLRLALPDMTETEWMDLLDEMNK